MIIPAIDIIGGQTVRLFKGDYDQVTYYDQTPAELVYLYSKNGAELIHIVDLQGARDVSQRQLKLIGELSSSTDVLIQTGGGVRSERDVAELLEAGAGRVVIGSLAIKDPKLVANWIQNFGPERVVLALDVALGDQGQKWLPTQAWQEGGQVLLEDVLDQFLAVNVKHVLCTDISRDGTLLGSNHQLYKELQTKYPQLVWQASGGIGSLQDISRVALTGVSGIIVGKALLDGKFTLKEAQSCWLAE
ncbi:MAG: 1-(5-phosphoribosyl)-5-[(5-phosphoribosylamino)methylideneamino]imidazole-4-carboxamide isomerase [Candidatus Marinimicrobia bacterium]|nr:1-(5-phosphoribosyl)-5-[(5-phosphoribosylamino)methylideneamino]imidazole-4-carboxamide isomerase [Candidatus Neomarinimicrobiota bacterium]